MKTLLATILSLTICLAPEAQQVINIADSNNVFAFKLYNEVRRSEDNENLFFSPFSISTALAMTYAGAKNETEKQMSHTLHFSLDQNTFHKNYKNYLEKIGSDTGKDLVMGIANSLWIANSLKLLPSFSGIVNTDYKSAAKNVDFSNTEQTRQEINSWVEQKTNNKIKGLIKPRILDADTKLVLVNAIYFNGKWKTPFPKDSTKNEKFHKTYSGNVKVNFMHNTAHYKYYHDDTLKAIDIPYADGKISMIVLLPQDRDDIDTIENKLNYRYYSKIVSSMSQQKIVLALPKFKTTAEFELADELSNMGMPIAFSSSANFKGMSDESLCISHVIHKAFIDVTEEGTEAAAATAVNMKMLMVMRAPVSISFIANHPFIFVIRDNATGSILFMGKIMDPTKE